MKIKKELLEVALVLMLGIIFVLALALNVQKIDNQTSQNLTNDTFEIDS